MADPSGGGSAPIRDDPHYIANLQRNYTFFADMGDDEIYQLLRMCNRQTFEADDTMAHGVRSGWLGPAAARILY